MTKLRSQKNCVLMESLCPEHVAVVGKSCVFWTLVAQSRGVIQHLQGQVKEVSENKSAGLTPSAATNLKKRRKRGMINSSFALPENLLRLVLRDGLEGLKEPENWPCYPRFTEHILS